MEKISQSEALASLYTAPEAEAIEVEVPDLAFLMVDGEGDPNTSAAFGAAAQSLFAVAEAIKASVGRSAKVDFDVMPLEGLWWVDDPSQFSLEDKSNWKWTLMIMQPELVTEAAFEQARSDVARAGVHLGVSRMRWEPFREGRAAQILHLGPHSEEGPKIEKVHRFIAERGGQPSGKHHEIYLKDVFHFPPEVLTTIIRQPFA